MDSSNNLSTNSLQFDVNDDLPKELCKSCSAALDQAYKFKIKCEFTDQKLRDLLSEMQGQIQPIVQESEYYQEAVLEKHGKPTMTECAEVLQTPEEIDYVAQDEEDEDNKDTVFLIDDVEFQHVTDENSTHYVGIDGQSAADALILESSVERLDEHIADESVNDDCHEENVNIDQHVDKDSEHLTYETIMEEETFEYDEELPGIVKTEGEENVIVIHVENYDAEQVEREENDEQEEEEEVEEEEEQELDSKDLKSNCEESNEGYIEIEEILYSDMEDGKTEEPRVSSTTSTQQRNKMFVCDTCNESFSVFSLFNSHKKSHGKHRYQCPICNRWFSKRYHLKNHQVVHENQKQFNCTKCEKRYTNQGNLDRHVRVFHNQEKTHVCDYCGKGFSQSSILRQHYAVHKEDRNFQCDLCQKFYKTQEYLNLHKMRHLPMEQRPPSAKIRTRKYKAQKQVLYCSYCAKKSNSLALHQSHMRTHTGEKPFECYQCQKRFSFQQSLKSHVLLHTGERPYKCNECGLKFRQIGHLQGHKLTHSGQKLHVCSVCKKSFSLRGNLTVHMRLHTGETPYACKDCDKQFYDCNGLKRHQLIHTRLKSRKTVPIPLAPSETASFECSYCSEVFDVIDTFRQHMTDHKETTDEDFIKPMVMQPLVGEETMTLPVEEEIYYIQNDEKVEGTLF